MATTYVLSTSIGKTRLAIGDTNVTDSGAGVKPDGTNFTDAELQAFLDDVTGGWQFAVPPILRTLANMYALMADTISLNEYSERWGDKVSQLHNAADQWTEKVLAQLRTDGFASNTDAPYLFGVEQYGAAVESSDS